MYCASLSLSFPPTHTTLVSEQLGMVSASIGAVVCVGTAARLGIPISSTHSTVGAVMGFAFIENHNAIVWWSAGNVGM